jgi:predicted metal-binding protein
MHGKATSPSPGTGSPEVISTPWRDVIILCRKCGKKFDGGFGPKRKDGLKTALRQALRDSGRRRQTRIMETSCLGICPKHGVTALNATHPSRLHVVVAGTDAADALRTLLGDHFITDGGGIEPA